LSVSHAPPSLTPTYWGGSAGRCTQEQGGSHCDSARREGSIVPGGVAMRLTSGQIAVIRSSRLRLLAIALLLISLVAVGTRQLPPPAPTPAARSGAPAPPTLPSATDPAPGACNDTATPTPEVTAVPDQPVTVAEAASTVDIDAGSVGGPTKITASAV